MLFKTSDVCDPYAPAFIAIAPPTVPGITLKNSKPDILLSSAKRATEVSNAAQPATLRLLTKIY